MARLSVELVHSFSPELAYINKPVAWCESAKALIRHIDNSYGEQNVSSKPRRSPEGTGDYSCNVGRPHYKNPSLPRDHVRLIQSTQNQKFFQVSPSRMGSFHVTPLYGPRVGEVTVMDTFHVSPPKNAYGKDDKYSNVGRTGKAFHVSRWLGEIRARIDSELAKLPPTPIFEQKFKRELLLDEEIKLRRTVIRLPADCPASINRLLGKSDDDIVISKFNIDFAVRDLRRMRSPAWLNDECINFYMQMIAERAKRSVGSFPSVHVFSSFFLVQLKARGYEAVRTSTRRIQPSVLTCDLILVPVHLGMHWCMAVIDMGRKTLFYYDSLHGNDRGTLTALRCWLDGESRDKLGIPFDFSGWSDMIPHDIPGQHNSYDCGVFSLVYAEHHSRRAPFTFSQANILYWRDRISYEIIKGSILPSND